MVWVIEGVRQRIAENGHGLFKPDAGLLKVRGILPSVPLELHRQSITPAPRPARQRTSLTGGGASELKLFEVEVGVGHVYLHLGDLALRVEDEGDPAARVWVDDRVAPLEAEG